MLGNCKSGLINGYTSLNLPLKRLTVRHYTYGQASKTEDYKMVTRQSFEISCSLSGILQHLTEVREGIPDGIIITNTALHGPHLCSFSNFFRIMANAHAYPYLRTSLTTPREQKLVLCLLPYLTHKTQC